MRIPCAIAGKEGPAPGTGAAPGHRRSTRPSGGAPDADEPDFDSIAPLLDPADFGFSPSAKDDARKGAHRPEMGTLQSDGSRYKSPVPPHSSTAESDEVPKQDTNAPVGALLQQHKIAI